MPVSSARRASLPFHPWEADLVVRWKMAGDGDEIIAMRLMRPVSQISGFDPVRPNGRRRPWRT